MYKAEEVVGEFREILQKMVWLNKIKMEDSLKGFKSSEVHCIDYVGSNADSNVTKLAETLYMTRGAISKLTKKLISRGIMESYQKPENKKEIYFRLTQQGNAVKDIHEKLHREFQERDKCVYDQFTEGEYELMLDFAVKYSRHLDEEIKKSGIDMKPQEE